MNEEKIVTQVYVSENINKGYNREIHNETLEENLEHNQHDISKDGFEFENRKLLKNVKRHLIEVYLKIFVFKSKRYMSFFQIGEHQFNTLFLFRYCMSKQQ